MTQASLEWGASKDIRPEETVMVALDLETTGLDSKSDRIIEVGATKFRGGENLGELSSLVNPHKKLSRFITSLTGISQDEVDTAPEWDSVAGKVAAFIGSHPIVGHRVSFDTGFLAANDVPALGPEFDTYELAAVVLPEGPEYSLGGLSTRFKIEHDNPHRALSDALATRDIFNLLVERLDALDPAILRQLARLGSGTSWTVAEIAGRLLAAKSSSSRRSLLAEPGIDRAALTERLRVKTDGPQIIVNLEAIGPLSDVFASGGVLAGQLAGYEERPQQIEMAERVATAINEGRHLIVEAGTGVGKSLAYLVPAALRALSGGEPVIVSTNTINLQEQLISNDLPAVETVLESMGIPKGALRIAQLKGRANYLCYRRWLHAQDAEGLDNDQARVLGKTLTWIQKTEQGDRSELALPRFESVLFGRMSANGAQGCPTPSGPCFLWHARMSAQDAHIIVINHALLLSHIAMGGGLLPDHSALIIDEAHHLEEVATRHLGFSVSQRQFEGDLTSLSGQRGILADVIRAMNTILGDEGKRTRVVERANAIQGELDRARQAVGQFYDQLGLTAGELIKGMAYELRIVDATRAQPVWSTLEIAWENMDLAASTIETGLIQLVEAFNSDGQAKSELVEATSLNTSAALDAVSTARSNLRQAIVEPERDQIYWLSPQRSDGTTFVNAAPLRVGPILAEELFAQERSVTLTSGTLGDGRTFDRLREGVGLEVSAESMLGSPFEYRNAALVMVPEDVPEPGRPGFNEGVANAIREIALATRDRTLVLFTSNSALATARDAIREILGAEGIKVVGQGPDGAPHRIMRALAENKETVALGSASLWEGIDLEAASIKTLMMARLPFPVPSQPVFEARSEQYEDSFNEFAVPEAIMKFRQGFGRLIRSRSDRGAFVILDRRVDTKRYGQRFIQALPDVRIERGGTRHVAERVKEWLTR